VEPAEPTRRTDALPMIRVLLPTPAPRGSGGVPRISAGIPLAKSCRADGVGTARVSAQRGISGTNMMCARAVPGNISHGALRTGTEERPVDSTVAKGM
jgi:hypothetical protein